MELFGIGMAELIAIFIIMLVVAGPKRMIAWAYIIGQYTAKARGMWREVMTQVQKEIDAAGVDIEVPKDIPTRGGLQAQMKKALTGAVKPAQDALNDVKADLNVMKDIQAELKPAEAAASLSGKGED